MINKGCRLKLIITPTLLMSLYFAGMPAQVFAADVYDQLSLKQAIDIALINNSDSKISYQSAAIAESQYQEALSARWPSVTLQGGFQHRDQAPTFVFPSSNIPLGNLGVTLAGLLGPSVPTSITVPQQNIKLMNQNTSTTSLQLMYPLYTGGKISSLISQAGFGKEIAQEEIRRTNLQVVRDVKRYYYVAQPTKNSLIPRTTQRACWKRRVILPKHCMKATLIL